MLLSYLQVIFSTIIAATFQTAECKSDPFPLVGSVAHWNCSQIVFEQCLSSETTMQEAYPHSGCTGTFPVLYQLQCFTVQSVVCPGKCVCTSVSCHMLAQSHCVLPDFYPLLMEIPILGRKPSDLQKYYWLHGFGVFRFTITLYQVMEDASHTVLCKIFILHLHWHF